MMSAFGRLYHAEHDEHPVFDDRFAKELMSGGEPMKKGMSKTEVETLLDKCGFTVKENLTPEQIQDKVTGENRLVKAFECVNYLYAERK